MNPMNGKMMLMRGGAWLLLATLLAVSPSGCGDDRSPSGDSSVNSPAPDNQHAGEDSVGVSTMPTVASLEVEFMTDGASEIVPKTFVVGFSHDIAASDGRELNGETEVGIEPALAGRWSFEKRDQLVFTPAEEFEPGASYEVTIKSLGVERTQETDEGDEEIETTRLEPASTWSHTYELPEFELVRMMTPVVVSDKNIAQIDLLFSAPVDANVVDDYANWRVNGVVQHEAGYSKGDRPNVVRVGMTHGAFSKERGYASVELALAGGLPFGGASQIQASQIQASKIRAPAANAHKSVVFGERIKVENVALEEGVDGFYVYVICDDAAVSGDEVYFRNVIGYNDYRVSRRCTPEIDSARRHIEIEPKVDFDIAPAAAGFQIRGDFDPKNYTIRLRPGLRSIDGGVLDKVHEQQFSVGQRSAVVQIVGEGRYIPPEAWDNLALRHRNTDELDIEVRHVPSDNLVFWMSGYRDTADRRTSNLVGKTTLSPRGKGDVVETTFVDIGEIVGQRKPGIYEVHVKDTGSKKNDTSRLLLTDINLLAKKSAPRPKKDGEDGEMASWSDEVFVWALDMHSSRPKSGVTIKLVRPSGFVMAKCRTNTTGACRLNVPSKDVDPTAPFALIASKGNDVTYLKYGELETRITGADTGGEPFLSPKPYRAAVYGDRDLYRPAEEVHLVGVLREHDQRAPKAGLPVEYEVHDARGRMAKQGVVETNDAGIVSIDHQLTDISPTGRWTLRLLVGKKAVASHDFYVEEFVPERMEVDVEPLDEAFYPEQKAEFGVHARYLFGASAKGSKAELRCRLQPKTFVPKGQADYKFGPAPFEEADEKSVDLGKAAGTIGEDDTVVLGCPETDISGAVGGEIIATASVFEAGSGRTTDQNARAWLHPTHYYIGLKSDVTEVEDGKPVTIEGVVVDTQGKAYKKIDEVELEIVNLLRNYSWYYNRSRGHHRRDTRWQPLITETQTVAVEDGRFALQITPENVRDGFAIRARAGESASTLQLDTNRQHYWSSWRNNRRYGSTPKVGDPTQLDIEGPDEIEVGKRHKIRFNAPYKGRALITLETHRVIEHAYREVEPGENTWSFRLRKSAPNVYASVFLIKDPHLDSKEAFLPERAFGVKSLSVDRSPYRHSLELATPKEVRPNSQMEVVVDAGRLNAPMYVTVAAVDEGILSLNNYETPDLTDQLIAKRALGVTTYDTVGWNVQMPEAGQVGPPGGGDGGGGSRHTGRIMPVKPVALWSGLVELPKSGKKTVTLDVPNYRGELRVMAIAATSQKVASTQKSVKVRDPLAIQTTTPRFLSAGDKVEIPVFVTNTTGKEQKVEVNIESSAFELPGSTFMEKLVSPVSFKADTKSATVADGESKTFVFEAETHATAGGARFKITASNDKEGSGSIESTDEKQLPIHSKKPRERLVQSIKLKDGKSDLKKHLKGWERHSERSTFWVSDIPYGRAFDHLKYLIRYPYGCVEQTSSSTRPMLFLSELMRSADPEGAHSTQEIDKRVNAGINRLLSMQTSQGGFGYWPGAGSPHVWGTTIATHTLLDAKKAGYEVPQTRLDEGLDWLRQNADNQRYRWAGGYIQYVLALTGRANKAAIRRALDTVDEDARGSHAEQRYLLKAALYLAGDRRYEDALKEPGLEFDSGERSSSQSFYSDLRRKAFQLNIFMDIFGHDAAGEDLMKAVAKRLSEGSYGRFNTQEVTWGVTGLGKWSTTGPNSVKSAVLEANKTKVPVAVDNNHGVSWSLARAADFDTLEIDVQSTNKKRDLYLVISSEGVRKKPTVSYGGSGLSVEREFLGADAKPLDTKSHRLGDLAYVRLTVRNTSSSNQQNIALVDRIPAGWEIENPRQNQKDQRAQQNAMNRFYTTSRWKREYMDIRDHKIAIFGNLGRSDVRQVVYPVRATLAGEFTVPSVHAESMYDSDVWARKKRGSITVKGPWSKLVD
jgi:uncharacterized protein YfaS (alpha-2-macroglobulin family)